MKKQSKTDAVLNHMKTNGYITSLEAFDKYNVTRLSSIIYNLRKRGMDIETIEMPFIDQFGSKSVYGKYILN